LQAERRATCLSKALPVVAVQVRLEPQTLATMAVRVAWVSRGLTVRHEQAAAAGRVTQAQRRASAGLAVVVQVQ
jgi:hypothetical protein